MMRSLVYFALRSPLSNFWEAGWRQEITFYTNLHNNKVRISNHIQTKLTVLVSLGETSFKFPFEYWHFSIWFIWLTPSPVSLLSIEIYWFKDLKQFQSHALFHKIFNECVIKLAIKARNLQVVFVSNINICSDPTWDMRLVQLMKHQEVELGGVGVRHDAGDGHGQDLLYKEAQVRLVKVKHSHTDILSHHKLDTTY